MIKYPTHYQKNLSRYYEKLQRQQRQLHDWFADRFDADFLAVLILAVAPLWDGVYVSTVSSGEIGVGSIREISQSIVFGLAAFSGGGVIATSMSLRGSIRRQVLAIIGVYLIVSAGVALTLVLMEWTRFTVPVESRIVFAMVLLSLATIMAGVNLKMTIEFQPWKVLVIIGGGIVIFRFLNRRLETQGGESSFDVVSAMAGSALSIMTAFSVTLLVVVFRGSVTRYLDYVWLRRGGAAAVGLIALSLLEFTTPSGTSLIAFITITAFGSAQVYRSGQV